MAEIAPTADIAGRAAGKLMLAGEYAVLFEPGCCLALGVGDIAWATWHDDGRATLTLDAYDSVRSWPLAAIPDDGLMGFIQGALTAAAGPVEVSRASLTVRVTGQLKGRKFGLGSSAATTIAVLRATLAHRNDAADPARLVALANGVHQAQQGGQGSGYDVVSIAHGGCVAYERTTATVRQLAWPAGLYGAALYTGQPSSTVAALRRGIGAETAGINQIARATDRLLAAWDEADVTAILAALANCETAFDELAASHPWMAPPALTQLREHIRAGGGVARTSGAGGGDCVWVWTQDRDRRDAIIAAWPEPCVARVPEGLAPVEAT